MNLLKEIFSRKATPTKDELHSYLKQTSDKKTTQKVEKASADSPLLNDAMEGFGNFGVDEIHRTPSFEQFQAQRTPTSWIRKHRSLINKIASVLLLAILGASVYLYWKETKIKTTDQIFAANFDEFYDPSIYALRSIKKESEIVSLEVKDSIKKQALLKFQMNKIPEAIQIMQHYLDLEPKNLQGQFYMGYMQLMEENTTEAISYLQPLAHQESEYKDEIRWYLGLAYVKNKDKETAKNTLQDLADNGHEFFAKKARRVLAFL